MLKKCYGLVLGLLVLTGSACVTPTHASSASIITTNIRAGSAVSPLEEGVVLYNNSSFETKVDDWCLINKAQVSFACFTPEVNEHIVIPAYSYATIVALTNSTVRLNHSIVYEPANRSSGAIVASSDSIALLNEDKQIVDQYTWSSSLSSAQQWSRLKASTQTNLYVDTKTPGDWLKVTYNDFPLSQVIHRPFIEEEPVDSIDPTIPSRPLSLPAIVTEVLPNAIGSDTGNEFIEIFNPNEQTDILLNGYQLLIGASLEKTLTLGEYTLRPGEYKIFTNSELGYTLLNTASKVVLKTDKGLMGETVMYSSPAEGESWELIEDTRQYTNQPTPGLANVLSIEEVEDEPIAVAKTVSQKPCATNQYRNTETNRCRLVGTSATATPATCKPGQERSLETNRCRAVASSAQSACKQGQERNRDTGRCRNVKKLSAANFGVKGAVSKQGEGMGWYMWATIGGIILLILGYAVWEWREELKKLGNSVEAKFAGKVN